MTRLQRTHSDASSPADSQHHNSHASHALPTHSVTHSPASPASAADLPLDSDDDDAVSVSSRQSGRKKSHAPSSSHSGSKLKGHSKNDEEDESPSPQHAASASSMSSPSRATRSSGKPKSRTNSPAGRKSSSAKKPTAAQIKKQLAATHPSFGVQESTTHASFEFPPPPPPSSSSSSSSATAHTSSSRKGSDVRREETAERHAKEAARLEKLHQINEANKAKAKVAAKLARQQTTSRLRSYLFIILPLLIIPLGIFLSSDLLFPNVPVPLRIGIDLVAKSLTNTTKLPQRQVDLLESALLAHAQGFEERAEIATQQRASHEEDSSMRWNQDGAALISASKPLVLVLASRAGSSLLGEDIVARIATLPGPSSSRLPILDLSAACRSRFSSRGDDAPYPPNLTPQQVRDIFTNFFSTAHGASPLEQGLVYISHASKMPRAAAEVFHRYVDDVSAPMRNAAFIFEVNAYNSQARYQSDAHTAVTEELQRGWKEQSGVTDEIIEPLLSRVIRTVIDIRYTTDD